MRFIHSGLNLSQSCSFFSFVLFSTSKQPMLSLRCFTLAICIHVLLMGSLHRLLEMPFYRTVFSFFSCPLKDFQLCQLPGTLSSLSHLSRTAVLCLDASHLRHVGELSPENQGSHNSFFREHTFLLLFVHCQKTLSLNVLFRFLFFYSGRASQWQLFSCSQKQDMEDYYYL